MDGRHDRRAAIRCLEQNGQSVPDLVQQGRSRHAAQRADFTGEMGLVGIAGVDRQRDQSGVVILAGQ